MIKTTPFEMVFIIRVGMIPKIIHYCWFGGNKLPKLAKKCIKSWKKYCPDYEIIRWDESNYDLSAAPLYVRQAYEAKKWAFVTDYVRLQIVYEQGGIYMDTDVELVKSLDGLLNNHAYFGFEAEEYVATGLGFGGERGAAILKEMMDDYTDIPFVKEDGSFDLTACPVRNTNVLLRHGLKQDNSMQVLDGVRILPSAYLAPMRYWSGNIQRTADIVSIHWYSASWQSAEAQMKHTQQLRSARRARQKDYIIHIPNRICMIVLGKAGYDKLKHFLRR